MGICGPCSPRIHFLLWSKCSCLTLSLSGLGKSCPKPRIQIQTRLLVSSAWQPSLVWGWVQNPSLLIRACLTVSAGTANTESSLPSGVSETQRMSVWSWLGISLPQRKSEGSEPSQKAMCDLSGLTTGSFTKILCQMGWPEQCTLVLEVLGAGKSKIKVLADVRACSLVCRQPPSPCMLT